MVSVSKTSRGHPDSTLSSSTLSFLGASSTIQSAAVAKWSGGAWNVTVQYELQPGWRFMTQKVSLEGDDSNHFIQSVELFNMTLSGCDFSSSFKQPPGGFLRCQDDSTDITSELGAPGIFVSIANPMSSISTTISKPQGSSVSSAQVTAGYENVGIKTLNGLYTSDMALIGSYSMMIGSGAWVRPHTLANVGTGTPPNMLNSAERDAIVDAVKVFLIQPSDAETKTVKTNVAWDENDWQIDIATQQGREEYGRIIDRNAQFGVQHVVFAPSNTDLVNGDLFVNKDSLLDVGWGSVLWMAMGLGVRNGTWSNASGVNIDAVTLTLTPILTLTLRRRYRCC